jgi:hypothetical protein
LGRLALFSFAAAALAAAVIARAETPAASAAASGAPPASSAPAQVAAKSDPVICEWEEDIGTRLGSHKVCMTKSQWQRDAEDSQDQLNDTTNRAYRMGTPGH